MNCGPCRRLRGQTRVTTSLTAHMEEEDLYEEEKPLIPPGSFLLSARKHPLATPAKVNGAPWSFRAQPAKPYSTALGLVTGGQ